ncbi:hypothetical protein Hanom_Chr09g00835751 [Helianthus anomalus]
MVPMLTWGLVRSNLPRAARTVRARRRWVVVVGVEEVKLGLWRERLVMKVEERWSLVEGFGRVKRGGEGEEEEEVKQAAAVAAAEMEAIGVADRIWWRRWIG